MCNETYLLQVLGIRDLGLSGDVGSALRACGLVYAVHDHIVLRNLAVWRTVSPVVWWSWSRRPRGPQRHERLAFGDLEDDCSTIPGDCLDLLSHPRGVLSCVSLCGESAYVVLKLGDADLDIEKLVGDVDVVISEVQNGFLQFHLCLLCEVRVQNSGECDLVLGGNGFLVEFVEKPVGALDNSLWVGVRRGEGVQSVLDGLYYE